MTGAPIAPVFDIQRFSIHDGPGIRTLVFFKGCNLRCLWCQNPEAQDREPIVAFYANRCRGSFECDAVCVEGAIKRAGFRIDRDRCTLCGDCVEACPHGALRLIGEQLTPEELMARVLPDKPYFGGGGGVTLSGGEPTLHPEFLASFVDLCLDNGIPVGLETAGRFRMGQWLPILGKLELIYFDLKILDGALHERSVGAGLDTILRNGEHLAKEGLPVEFRMPLVPGHTDTRENIDGAIRFLRSIGQSRLHLLEYHGMGEVKIDVIRGAQPKLGLCRHRDEDLAAIEQRFEAAGIEIAGRRRRS